MAATELDIKVFAMFPTGSEPSNWTWVHCLTFELATLTELHFSSKPFKWIRYATGIVVGAQGHLSFEPNSPDDVMNYDDDLTSTSANLYYHVSPAERRRMFPTDPAIGRTDITSSEATVRREAFRSDVVARDGTCVLTGQHEENCDAVHLLPHSKGDQYIETYTQHRSRDPARGDLVREIDDIRNGMLLNPIAHRQFGKRIAFLVTPNFAMTTTDIDPNAEPTEKRCVVHLFDPDRPMSFGDSSIHSGSPVRMPASTDDWPPGILFDAVYANCVQRHFSPETLETTLKPWKSSFYPGEITNAGQASYQKIIDKRAADTESRKEQSEERAKRAAIRADRESRADKERGDSFDYLMMTPYVMIPPDELEAFWREAAAERAERERSHLEDKIGSWTREVVNACHDVAEEL